MPPQLKCIVIHGCPLNIEKAMDPQRRTYDKHWIPWIKEKLIEKGIPTEAPLLPEPWAPVYEKFKAVFEKFPVDENTILIGHSCGCTFLTRWLGETKRNVFKLILVAPWKIADESDSFHKAFYVFPLDPTIKERVKEIVIFTSDDEKDEGKEGLKMFHQALGGKIVDLPKHGHYTMGDMGTAEFPELLDAILKC